VDRPDFILIWGVSGAGKSRYCKWLAQRGYMDSPLSSAAQESRATWQQFWHQRGDTPWHAL